MNGDRARSRGDRVRGEPTGRARGARVAAGRRRRDRRRLRAARRRGARPARAPSRRRLRLGRSGRGRRGRRARAPPSTGIRPRRTRPISSSRSTPRSRAARSGSCWSTAGATGSITCSATSLLLASPRSPACRSRRSPGPRGSCVARGGDPPVDDRRRARQPRHAAPGRRPGARDHHHAACATGCSGEDLAAGNDARRQQRARRAHGLGAARGRHAARGAAVRARSATNVGSRAMNARRAMIGLVVIASIAAGVRQQRQEHAASGPTTTGKPPKTVVLHDHDSFARRQAGARRRSPTRPATR